MASNKNSLLLWAVTITDIKDTKRTEEKKIKILLNEF